jgi:hypothetical protein
VLLAAMIGDGQQDKRASVNKRVKANPKILKNRSFKKSEKEKSGEIHTKTLQMWRRRAGGWLTPSTP